MTGKTAVVKTRSETEVFSELSRLCRSPGYIHALSYLCFRDNFVRFSGEITAKDMLPLFSRERLIRTEISTLIGLMVQGEISPEVPTAEIAKKYITQTEKLLIELHQSMMGNPFEAASIEKIKEGFNPFTLGQFLREPIFYGGESAYLSQYIDFSLLKFQDDTSWLIRKKGFSIQGAQKVVRTISEIHDFRVTMSSKLLPLSKEWPAWLLAHSFNVQEIAESAKLDQAVVRAVIQAFTLPKGSRNETFLSLSDFNAVNATPLLALGDDFFAHFQGYGLAEALYEAPFYWMCEDADYVNEAMIHRGYFTEEFCYARLTSVFGGSRVYKNVRLYGQENKACKKGDELGEIDVLVIFGNRVIIVQTKSKRLTLEARKGNDSRIKDDFKKSIQDAYDQGLLCSKYLLDATIKCVDMNGGEISISEKVKEIYILCVVSDNYPALSFQARQFLKYETDSTIQPPVVLDIFALDVMAEMLNSPLYFLSYVNRRANYHEKVHATNEQVILAYHLKKNLWLDAGCDILFLEDDFSVDLDVAMAVRRDGVKGKATPDGILTRLSSSFLGKIIKQIEFSPLPATIDLGFLLLTISEDSCREIGNGIKELFRLAKIDQKSHDLTVGFSGAKSGLTIHVNDDTDQDAARRLKAHCIKRKYRQRANEWFGLCVSAEHQRVRFGLSLSSIWEKDEQLDVLTKDMPEASEPLPVVLKSLKTKKKLGRNDLCPCGSNKKYKKCCLNKQRAT